MIPKRILKTMYRAWTEDNRRARIEYYKLREKQDHPYCWKGLHHRTEENTGQNGGCLPCDRISRKQRRKASSNRDPIAM